MKTFFVVNPQSAGGATGRRWAELAATIARILENFGVEFTTGPLAAVELTRTALKAGYDCIVAVGGDGTINEVVNGFFEDGQVINPAAALGVMPRGTGGDFRKTFDWDTDFVTAVERLKTPDTRPFDVGRVELHAHDGTPRVRHFANVCSFGVSGKVVDAVNAGSKVLGGRASFVWASLRSLAGFKDQVVKVRFDGGPEEVLPVTALAVANGKFFGGGMKVAPTADVSDGVFDVTIWSGYTLADFVFKAPGLYSGAHAGWSRTRVLRCTSLSATSDEQVLVDMDGEQPGMLPLAASILPSAIRLKV